MIDRGRRARADEVMDALEEAPRRGRDYGEAGGYGPGGAVDDFEDVTGLTYDDERFADPEAFFEPEPRAVRSHRGRGPRGYRRSDARIYEDVCERLTEDPYLDASDLEVSVAGGEVTLNGTVRSRPAKRRAEDLAEQVPGVGYVQNNLRLQPRATVLMGAGRTTGTPPRSGGGDDGTPVVM